MENGEMTAAMKQKRNVIVFLIIAVMILAIVTIMAIITNGELNDSFFVSDGTKYVLNADTESEELEKYKNVPVKSHAVYYYRGDTVTGMEMYFEFENKSAAEEVFADYQEIFADTEKYAEVKLNKKYIIIVAAENEYKDLNATEIGIGIQEYTNKIENGEEGEGTDDVASEEESNGGESVEESGSGEGE